MYCWNGLLLRSTTAATDAASTTTPHCQSTTENTLIAFGQEVAVSRAPLAFGEI
jgi:hypothetical protein